MITLIAACSKNRVIGKDNQLIWHLPEDLKRFKRLTTGKTVLMGRKSYESIGHPLPNPRNCVLTRDKKFNPNHNDVLVYNKMEDVIPLFNDIWILGGGEIYRQIIDFADVIELTLIDKEFEGDTYFPEIDSTWIESIRESYNNGEYDYHFITYTRRK